MRALPRLLLILLLVLTGQSLAAARGQAQIAGEVVLCAGELTRVVTVDADGNPVSRVTICPDMAPTLLDAVAETPAAPAPSCAWQRLLTGPRAALPVASQSCPPKARDPPIAVLSL